MNQNNGPIVTGGQHPIIQKSPQEDQ